MTCGTRDIAETFNASFSEFRQDVSTVLAQMRDGVEAISSSTPELYRKLNESIGKVQEIAKDFTTKDDLVALFDQINKEHDKIAVSIEKESRSCDDSKQTSRSEDRLRPLGENVALTNAGMELSIIGFETLRAEVLDTVCDVWWYGEKAHYEAHFKDNQCFFKEERTGGQGILHRSSDWWEGDIKVGQIRLQPQANGTLLSQFRKTSEGPWGNPMIARRGKDVRDAPGNALAARVPQLYQKVNAALERILTGQVDSTELKCIRDGRRTIRELSLKKELPDEIHGDHGEMDDLNGLGNDGINGREAAMDVLARCELWSSGTHEKPRREDLRFSSILPCRRPCGARRKHCANAL
jgi:hypothetical protein